MLSFPPIENFWDLRFVQDPLGCDSALGLGCYAAKLLPARTGNYAARTGNYAARTGNYAAS